MGEKNNDLMLIKRVQKGDKSAYDVLVRKYQHKIIKLISRYVHDPEAAQDVAQVRSGSGHAGDHAVAGRSCDTRLGVNVDLG